MNFIYLRLFLHFFLQAMKAFIDSTFKITDINGDGIIGAEEYRYNVITRIAVDDIAIVDHAFQQLLNVSLCFLIYKLSNQII